VKLNLGCGETLLPGYVGLDILPPAHVIGDARALPFASETFGEVLADNVCEHFDPRDLPHVFGEVHRVLAPGGFFRVIVPGADLNADLAFRDPTHLNFWSRGRTEYLWIGGQQWRHGERAGFPPFAAIRGPVPVDGWAWLFDLRKR
jgi:SAM-dependent methyltransferase